MFPNNEGVAFFVLKVLKMGIAISGSDLVFVERINIFINIIGRKMDLIEVIFHRILIYNPIMFLNVPLWYSLYYFLNLS